MKHVSRSFHRGGVIKFKAEPPPTFHPAKVFVINSKTSATSTVVVAGVGRDCCCWIFLEVLLLLLVEWKVVSYSLCV